MEAPEPQKPKRSEVAYLDLIELMEWFCRECERLEMREGPKASEGEALEPS